MPSQRHIGVGATGLELAATCSPTMLSLGAMRDQLPPSARVGAYLGLSSTPSTCRPNSDLPAAHPARAASRHSFPSRRRRHGWARSSPPPPSTGSRICMHPHNGPSAPPVATVSRWIRSTRWRVVGQPVAARLRATRFGCPTTRKTRGPSNWKSGRGLVVPVSVKGV